MTIFGIASVIAEFRAALIVLTVSLFDI